MPPVVELLYMLNSHRNVLMFCVLVNQSSVSKKVNESAVHVDEFSDEGSDVYEINIIYRNEITCCKQRFRELFKVLCMRCVYTRAQYCILYLTDKQIANALIIVRGFQAGIVPESNQLA